MKYITLTTSNKKALVDDQDYDLVSRYTWYLGKNGYPESRMPKSEGKKLMRLHHLILPNKSKQGLFVDHINMNGCDNRRSNLRYATKSENMRNRNAPSQNTSGFKGVMWCTYTKKWRSWIQVNNKRHEIGRFVNRLQAAEAYNKAALRLHGDFAKLNII